MDQEGSPLNCVVLRSGYARTDHGRGRDAGLPGAPRADPYVRNYLIRLLPWVVTRRRSQGYGCRIRAGGSQWAIKRPIRPHVRRLF